MTNPKDPRSELEEKIATLRKSFLPNPEEMKQIMQAVDSYVGERERLAEGRGRVSVITSFKDWADATEVTYQQLMQTELDKANALKAERKDGV